MPDAVPSSPPSPASRRIGPLFALFPFLRPYAGRWALAFLALVTSAGATLVLPVAFKYLIDRGFASGERAHIDRYFFALFVVSLYLPAPPRHVFISCRGWASGLRRTCGVQSITTCWG